VKWRVLVVAAISMALLVPHAVCLAADDDGQEPKPLAVGDNAPDFKLKDLHGKEFHLKGVLQKNAVLLVFFATWHPRSRTQIVGLKPVAEEFKGLPLKILAVALDRGGKEVVGPFAGKQELNFSVLLDPDLTTKDKYQIKAILPLAFVIGHDGKIKRMEKTLDTDAIKRIREAAKAAVERIPASKEAQPGR